jgi:hypothetical protein
MLALDQASLWKAGNSVIETHVHKIVNHAPVAAQPGDLAARPQPTEIEQMQSCRATIDLPVIFPSLRHMKKPAPPVTLPRPKDAFPIAHLNAALQASGDYVYAYYGKKQHPESPFYVGKGRGTRALAHWVNAASGKDVSVLKAQEVEIRQILQRGDLPTVKLLAYNVEETQAEQTYSLVERVIQDAFGIQRVWEKRPGMDDRLVNMHPSTLVQVREDSSSSPVLSFDALIGLRGARSAIKLPDLVTLAGAPVLLVGLMKTYHPSYSHGQLATMARMYWRLEHLKALPAVKGASNAALLAWRTLGGVPTIVGAWRIKKNSFDGSHAGGRYSVSLNRPDLELRRKLVGVHLPGTGMNYMGPRIFLPEN